MLVFIFWRWKFCMVGSFECLFWKMVSFWAYNNVNMGITGSPSGHSMKSWYTSSWRSNPVSGHFSVNPKVFGYGRMGNHFGPLSEATDWPEGQEWASPGAKLLHEGLNHLLREGGQTGHVVNVVQGVPQKMSHSWEPKKLGTSYSETTSLLGLKLWLQGVLLWTLCCRSFKSNWCLVSAYEVS